jgi:flavodoxin/Fe-S-cluster-containing hydrogenase component 2
MKLGIFYFSATGNTEKIGETISSRLNKLGVQTQTINIAAFNYRKENPNLTNYDFLIFGFPVWGSVIPGVCRDWLTTVKAADKWCATFFTYGGPTIGISHYHTKLLLNKQRFKVLASAEFLGKHTFNVAKGFNFLPERPNQNDFDVATEFAKKLKELFSKEDKKEIIIEKPENADNIMDRIQSSKKTAKEWVPSRYGKECSMCRTCEENCPTNAFNADTGEADKLECISCMRCVTSCPDEAIEFRRDMTEVFERLKGHYELTDEKLKKLESKISY